MTHRGHEGHPAAPAGVGGGDEAFICSESWATPAPGGQQGCPLGPDLTVLSNEAVDSPRAVRSTLGSSL